MPHLTRHDVMTMFMALAVLLGCAKLAAELMQKIGQPSILGEISVGIFLGPTVFGATMRDGDGQRSGTRFEYGFWTPSAL